MERITRRDEAMRRNPRSRQNEAMDVTMDRLRRKGTLAGWQKSLYRYIVLKLGRTYLARVTEYIYDYMASLDVKEATEEEVIEIAQLACMDFIKAYITGDDSALEV